MTFIFINEVLIRESILIKNLDNQSFPIVVGSVGSI